MQLRYVDTDEPGLSRRRCGRGFVYLYPHGATVRDVRIRHRLQALAVPPAWEGVWFCRDPAGHIQATGRDARWRKQYVYHPEWQALRDRTKFDQLADFGAALPRLRARVDRDLAASKAHAGAVLAAAVRLLDSTQLNDYLREAAGATITAKHFRTWIATVTVLEAWLAAGEDAPLKIGAASRAAAARLHNTPAVTRRSYIDPDVLRIATERVPTDSERRLGARAAGGLSGAERLCLRLLAKH